jgi:hypothetical protein
MKPLGLLISGATPAASWPIEAIFSACNTWLWSCLISVRSWKVATTPNRTPSASTIGAQEMPIGTRVPSQRVIVLSAPRNRMPSLRLRAMQSSAGASLANQRRRQRPRSSSAGSPRISSAGGLQAAIIPSSSITSSALFMFWRISSS